MNCLSIHVVQHISCEKKDQEKVPSAYPRDFLCNGSQDLTLMVKEWLRIIGKNLSRLLDFSRIIAATEGFKA